MTIWRLKKCLEPGADELLQGSMVENWLILFCLNIF